MTGDAIIGRVLPCTLSQWSRATLLRMARETLCPKIFWSFARLWLHVRIVAGDARHFPFARAIALAEPHREIVLQQIVLRRRLPAKWHQEDAEGVVQKS